MRISSVWCSCAIVAAVCCAVLAGPDAAVATTGRASITSRQGSAWSAVSVPEPGAAFSGKLLGATCSSKSSCLAVGWGSTTGSLLSTLVEHWNGRAWAQQASPNPNGSGDVFPQLNAVSCVTASDCTTVGTDFTTSNTANTVAEQWNGSSWSVATTPDASGATTSTLTGVSCETSTFCMAVGSAGTTSPDVISLAEQWNGSAWSVDTTPNVEGAIQTFLTSVACPTTSECLAVGYSLASSGTDPIVEQWNGTTWTLVNPPVPTGSADNELTAIACPGASTCFATGRTYATSSSAPLTLAEVWDGTGWTTMNTPNPSAMVGAFFNSVSCPTPTDCEAAGEGLIDQTGDTTTLVENLSDGTWTLETSPNESGVTTSLLSAVACPSGGTTCIGAGQYYTPDEDHLLALHKKPSGTWVLTAVPGSTTPAATYLNGSACSTVGCIGVGESFPANNFNTSAVIERWNGSTWSLAHSAEPGGAVTTDLFGAACPATKICFAVGSVGIGTSGSDGDTTTFAEKWSGSTWSTETTPNPAGDLANQLTSVACPTSSSCLAAGFTASAPNGTPTAITEVLTKKTWALQMPPPPAGAISSSLAGISCPAPGACVAVGSFENASDVTEPLAETWNGTTWSPTAPPLASGTTGGTLLGVSCPSPGTCTAVGDSDLAGGTEVTLAEQLAAGSWSVTASQNPSAGTEKDVLTGVACPSANDCTASGYLVNSSGDETLLEQWDGAAWTVVTSGTVSGELATGLNGIACLPSATCTAVGSGPDGLGQDDALVEQN